MLHPAALPVMVTCVPETFGEVGDADAVTEVQGP